MAARYGRRSRFRRRGTYRRRGSVRGLLSRIKRKVGRYSRLAQTLRTGGWGRLNPGRAERKYYDVNIATTAIPLAVSDVGTGLGSLVDMVQGTGVTQRVGNKITVKSLEWCISATWQPISTADNVGHGLDMKFVIDTQCNKTAATSAMINNTTGFPTPLNLENRRRFIVVKHKKCLFPVNLGIGASTFTVVSAPSTVLWKGYKRMNLDVIYSGVGPGVGSIVTNNLGWLGQSSASGAAPQIYVRGYCRVRYTDT